MFELLKRRYAQLSRGKPGERFRHYHMQRQEKEHPSRWKRILQIALGVGFIAGGLLLSIPPGVPGFIVTFFGLALIAARSYSIATFLDALEMSARSVFMKNRDAEHSGD